MDRPTSPGASDWQQRHHNKRHEYGDAIARVPRGKHIFISSGAAEPVGLVSELVAQAPRFADNTIVHLLTLGPAPYVDPRYATAFRHEAFFIGPNVRDAVAEGRADYVPVFLSQIPALMRSRRMPIDVALVQTTPPDRFGYVNLGVSVDVVLAAIETAHLVIAEINPRMPRVHGDGWISMSRIDTWVLADRPVLEVEHEPLDAVALEIGQHVARLVDDGATLQMGIGRIPDAVLRALSHKRDLGIWSEMISDGVVDLAENGNVTGRFKRDDRCKITASFCFGTRRLYDFVDDNPGVAFRPSDCVNDPQRIAAQHKMVAINGALQIDLTGQVCADSIGGRFYSGIGGQVDFIRGASMCPAGKPIVALPSTALQGKFSRIVATLDPGAGVVTSRGDVRYVVTEHGIADLLGKSVRERALSLVAIAHPDFRAELLAAAKNRRYALPDQIAPSPRYPHELVREIRTKDGAPLRVRPIRITDEPKMRDLFYSLSERSIHHRWLSAVKRMPHTELQRYLDVDHVKNAALVAETIDPEREPEIVAVARYATDPATDLADLAFVVRDDWQGRGVGSELVRLITEMGRDRGLAGFTALVAADNGPMLRAIAKSNLEVHSTLEAGVYSLTLSFREAPRSSTV